MRRLFCSSLLALAFFASACGDDTQPPAAPDAGADAPPIGAIGPCLGQPTRLERPPTGALPCELLPPGFVATTAAPRAEAPR